VILEGITQKGRNRVNELGSEWQLVRVADSVQFNPERGPWLLVQPPGRPDKSRWVHHRHDPDFKVIQ
jgi:hypothetical protein